MQIYWLCIIHGKLNVLYKLNNMQDIFQAILEDLVKVFMSPTMSIATSQEIIFEMKKNINIKISNLDKVISKAMEENRDLDLTNIVVHRKRIITDR